MRPAPELRASPRQLELLRLAADGRSDKEIALELGITVATIKTYWTRLFRDNGVHTRTQAVSRWAADRRN